MRYQLWRIVVALLIPATIVAGCATPQGITPIEAPAPIAQEEIDTSAPPSTEMLRAPEENPTRGGTLKTAWSMSPTHFDLHQGGGCAGCNMMYNGLVMWNLADGYRSILPALAESWSVSDDQTVYTFELRDGVTFHDGTAFDAADVVATFERIVNPGDNLSVGGIREEMSMVESVSADGDSTVVFTLSQPTAYFLEILAGDGAVVYSDEELAANDGDLRGITAPTGTGPFRFADYIRGEKLVLEANPDYWNPELPYVDSIELLHVPAWADRGTAVLTGQADFSWNVSVDTWEEGNSREGIEAARAACLNSHMVAINNEADGPLSDPRVRQAIHLAVNRQALIDTFAPVWEPAFVTRWLPSASPYATPQDELLTMPGYRPEKDEDIATAKELMAEAGYPDGFETTFTAWTEAASSEVAVPAFAELLRTSLGIEGEIEVIERARTADVLSSGEFSLFKSDTYASPILDPYPLWNTYLRTDSSQNWSRYSNPEFDTLLDELATEIDPAARQELVNQGLDLLDANPPFFLIGFCAHSPMWQEYVKGLAIEDRLFSKWGRFETVWLDQ